MSFCLGKRSRWGPQEYGPQTPGRMRSAKKESHGKTQTNRAALATTQSEVSARELEDIKARAHALGMRPAHFGRALLLDKNRQPASHSAPANNTRRLIHSQLVRLGNNLNQMVRHLHQTGDPVPADLEPLLNDIRRLIARISE
jgi:hypothetical protein